MLYKLAHSPLWGRHFLNLSPLLSYDSKLCQINIKLASTVGNITLREEQFRLLVFWRGRHGGT